jgi:hypothetical protein
MVREQLRRKYRARQIQAGFFFALEQERQTTDKIFVASLFFPLLVDQSAD